METRRSFKRAEHKMEDRHRRIAMRRAAPANNYIDPKVLITGGST